jgi:hypothetical protein
MTDTPPSPAPEPKPRWTGDRIVPVVSAFCGGVLLMIGFQYLFSGHPMHGAVDVGFAAAAVGVAFIRQAKL